MKRARGGAGKKRRQRRVAAEAGVEVPVARNGSVDSVKQWKVFWMKHSGCSRRLCKLGQLAHEVFFGALWSGGQMSWRSDTDVYRLAFGRRDYGQG
jgi:hypothetical protein